MSSQPPGGQPPIPPYQPPSPAQVRRSRSTSRAILVVVAFAVVLVVAIVIAAASGGGKTSGSPAASVSTSAPAVSTTAPAVTPAAATTAPAAPQYTVAQQQAIASAESYLSDGTGFSRAGLYQQLHSQYGEGFSASLARFAVSHVSVNWYQQAVLSARSYMQSEPGWSYSGLVQQLDSPYGEQFTVAQAEYAAKAVGL